MSDENIKASASSTEPQGGLFDIINKLFSNQTQKEEAPAASPLGDSNILSSLLSNPEIMSKLPDIISMISPLMSNLSPQGSNNTQSMQKTSLPISHSPQSHEAQNRSALLCALKPYLKKERQEAIDYMIKLSRLGDILKTL